MEKTRIAKDSMFLKNLIEDLQKEINRCKSVSKEFAREVDTAEEGWKILKVIPALEKAISNIAVVRYAGAGMSSSEFNAKVRSALKKLQMKYGGKQTGSVLKGDSWQATIERQNASNGEVAGKLVLKTEGANPKTYTEFFNYDNAFKNAGINPLR